MRIPKAFPTIARQAAGLGTRRRSSRRRHFSVTARPVLTLLSLALAHAGAARADSFRCGTYLIDDGMQAAEIREKCGSPDKIEHVEEPVMARNANGAAIQVGITTIEYWTYERGPQRFAVRLRIDGGTATEIELLERRGR